MFQARYYVVVQSHWAKLLIVILQNGGGCRHQTWGMRMIRGAGLPAGASGRGVDWARAEALGSNRGTRDAEVMMREGRSGQWG